MSIFLSLGCVALAFVLGWKIPRGIKTTTTEKKQKTTRICERQTAREMQNFINYDGSVQE